MHLPPMQKFMRGEMKRNKIIGIIIGIIFIIVVIFVIKSQFSRTNETQDRFYNDDAEIQYSQNIDDNKDKEVQYPQNTDENKDNFLEAPVNLVLPFDVENMGGGNEFVTPFGLIRHERDRGHGHAGIDVPLSRGDKIYAVSDGTIIINEPATDGGEGNNFEGNNVVLLIAEGYNEGEGWGFLYEHINLDSGISVGSIVNKRQLIGKSALTNGNNHLGLVYYFNDFKYVREPKCWVEHLNGEEKQKLLTKWGEIRTGPVFIDSWKSSFEDGAYPYRALLNEANYPNGPQLCYEYGLDAREFA